ncbi:MAG TPA: TlpA family protein disulfide reductase [Bacteroidetes bacterium]|nr:TlpA family protein disulfide reductase [Bacteroidota bacterium]
MSKLREKIKNYFKKKKTLSIVLDFLFYVLIILFIIPGTRKTILPVFMRTILHPPLKNVSTIPLQKITENDYQWPLNKLDGKQVFLGDFKQQVLFINFWATWCPPCRAEMPGIQKLYEKYGNKVKFLMITAEDPGSVKAYIKKNSYTFPIYLQQYKAPAVFRSNSIPTTFIVDAKGGIVLLHKGASKWNSGKIEHLLDTLIAEK